MNLGPGVLHTGALFLKQGFSCKYLSTEKLSLVQRKDLSPDCCVGAESSLPGSPGWRQGRRAGETLQQGGGEAAHAAVRSPAAVQGDGGRVGGDQTRLLLEERLLLLPALHLGEDEGLQHAGDGLHLGLTEQNSTGKDRQFSVRKVGVMWPPGGLAETDSAVFQVI